MKSTFKKVKTQIQKGANPEKAARRGYDNACDYFEVLNKTVLIQQGVLACLSKCLAHILQRELYTMCNTGLLRHEAEMTLLQPHLGDTRCQELRNSPFWPSSLFKSELVKEKTSSSKKAPLKTRRVSHPIKTSPFVVPTTRKEAPTGNAPMGTTPPKAVINLFPQSRETEQQRLQGSFSTSPQGLRAWKPLPPMVRAPLIHSGYKALYKEQALASCIQSLLSKKAIESLKNVKSLRFTVTCF